MNEPTEKDFLKYTGNKVPRVIRLAWTVLIVFVAMYVIAYALPDLKEWIGRMR